MATPIDVSEEAGVRYLHFGSHWIQGAMRIARPWALELDYTRNMMLALLLHGRSWPRKVLVIGLGAASIPKFLHRHRPRAQVRVVEIDERVIAAARQFFRLPADDPPRLATEVADGDDYVARTRDAFDLVVVDGFDAKGRAGTLDTDPFYLRARRILSARGVLVVNLLGRSRGYRGSVERIGRAFDDRVAHVKSESGNVIVFASAGEPIDLSFRELRQAAAGLRRETGLNLLPTVARLMDCKSRPGDRLVL
ncbi:MAG TPA: fused MFS/spermidine synthase [Casimicrobiaceae bacterium]|nr:fused MFS/spermidine synthase [Casimicrobiaceae bacterium]